MRVWQSAGHAALWTVALAFHAALVAWMLAGLSGTVPPSDDALFLGRGLVHFSVLEFSPHFPAYPGFILLGRALLPFTDLPLHALGWVAVGAICLLPWAMAWAARCLGGYAVLGYALGVTQPLLPSLGSSFLSDGSGLLFLILGLALLVRPLSHAQAWGSWAAGGVLLGLALVFHPSYGVIIAVLGGGAFVWSGPAQGRQTGELATERGGRALWHRRWALLLGGGGVVIPVFGGVLALEGAAYVDEGLRFFAGHTLLWGHTLWSVKGTAPSWIETLCTLPGGLLWAVGVFGVLGFWAVRLLGWSFQGTYSPWVLVATTAGASLIWALTMQNPDNPRHLAPVVVLMLVMVAGMHGDNGGGRRFWPLLAGCLLLFQGGVTANSLVWPPWITKAHADGDPKPWGDSWKTAPMGRLVAALETDLHPSLVVTNTGVYTLRDRVATVRVADAYYAADAHSLIRTVGEGRALWVRSRPLPPNKSEGWWVVRVFLARYWGDKTLWVYQQNSP